MSDSASDQPMLTPAPSAVEKPTSSAVWELEATAAAKIGASEDTVPSIIPTSAGCTTRNTKSRSFSNPARWIRRAMNESVRVDAVSVSALMQRQRTQTFGLGQPK